MTKSYWVQTYTTVITVGGMLAVRPVKPIKTHLSTGIIPLYWLLGALNYTVGTFSYDVCV